MKIIKENFEVVLNFKSPLIVNSRSDSTGIVIYGDSYIIPGTTIQGIVRDRFREITTDNYNCKSYTGELCGCPECSIFGSAGFNPSRAYFEDFYCPVDDEKKGQRSTIAVNRYTGNTVDGALLMKDVIENCVFKGNIEVYFNDNTIEFRKFFIVALKSIEYIGSSKSRGYGFVELEVKSSGKSVFGA